MQIQSSTAASAAAGSVSQATSRDRTAASAGEAAHISSALGVERIARGEATDADRDAQGGGQGLADRREEPAQAEPHVHAPDRYSNLPVTAPEPASRLDIVG